MESPADTLQTESPTAEHYLATESRKMAKGGVVVIIGTLVAQGLSMAATLWIARVLGPDKYGLISLAISILLPLATLAGLGLPNALVRFIPVHVGNKEDDRVAGVISSAFVLGIITSLLITAAVVILSPLIANEIFSDPRLEPVLRVLALTIPLTVLVNLATAATRGLKVMHFDALVQISGPIFRILTWGVGLLLLANLLDAAIYATVLQQLFPALLAIGFAYWIFRKYFGQRINWEFKNLWIYSTPLILSSLMYSIAPRIDRLVLGIVSDTSAVGIYSAAASLIIILKLTHSSIVKTFLPVIADAYNRISVNRAKTLYVTVTHWDARLSFTVVVTAMLIAKEVLGLLGESYTEALMPFVILAIAVYIGTIPGPTGAFLQMTNHQRIEAINSVMFFFISPIIQYVFALWLGWIGVAIGILVMTFIINLVQIVEINHFYDFHPFQKSHLLFTILSIGITILCAFASITQPLLVRLILLVSILSGLIAYIYLFRTSTDELLIKMIIKELPLGKTRK